MKNNTYLTAHFFLYLILLMGGIAVSSLMIFHYPVFNADGVIYLKTADVFLSQGVKAAFHVFKWPFYSILVAYAHQFLNLKFVNAAYFVDTTFFVLTGFVYLNIIKKLTDDIRIYWLAILVFLLFHPFTELQREIIRGHGYWFFSLLSLYFLIRFSDKQTLNFALLWACSLVGAVLFRIEGIVFLILAPFVVYFFGNLNLLGRVKAYLRLNLILFAIVLCLYIVYHLSLHRFNELGRIPEIVRIFRNAFFASNDAFNSYLSLLKTYVLGHSVNRDVWVFLIGGMFLSYIGNIIIALSFAYVLIFVGGFFCKTHHILSRRKKLIIFFYIAINIFVTLFVYMQNIYLSSRYLIALGLTVLCLIPFSLFSIYQAWRNRPAWSLNNILFPLVCLLLLSLLVATIYPFGTTKKYVYNATQWLKHNSQPTEIIYSNDGVFSILADRASFGWKKHDPNYFNINVLPDFTNTAYGYIVLNVRKRQLNKLKSLQSNKNLILLKKFPDPRGNIIIIYKVLKR